ncbi:MAG: ABC transporter substrate-binding protein [Anaerolineales bacterium]|nr:ABC transporter substrate-binding protein [Anaerolineales bacterium]
MRARKSVNSGAAHCLLLTVCFSLLSACTVTRPVIKIGLVAPFEGRYRDVGYEVVFAVRLAVREINAAGGVGGYSVELVALDDSGDEQMALEQARKLATDASVIAVIGHWRENTTLAAAPEYERAGIPLIAPSANAQLPTSTFKLWNPSSCHLITASNCFESLEDLELAAVENVTITVPAPLPADSADATFAERYRPIAFGYEPQFNAVLAYDAARLIFDALARDIAQNQTPSRVGVAEMLAQSSCDGLSGKIEFSATRQWQAPNAWVYVWRGNELVKP